MCGICGISSFKSSVDTNLVEQMTLSLSHRGPDERGWTSIDTSAFGNARLSILGVENGQQPIISACGQYLLVCNGEIYNYVEMREALRSKGVNFKTDTDVEVILHSYITSGIDHTLSILDGMFAFCIHDRDSQRTIIARDRYGIKPLFYAENQKCLFFGSEIKSILTTKLIDTQVDYEALSIFLSLGYIPDPWTTYKNISRLPPGHYMTHSPSGISKKKYFDYDYSQKIKINKKEAVEETSKKLDTAIKKQIISEGRVSTLLSGGIDSTLILAGSSRIVTDLTAYTIGFSDSLFDESNEAKLSTERLGVKHVIVKHELDDFLEKHISRQMHFDEPYAHWCNTAFEHVAETIKNDGTKVVLSGDGGDELFFGYPTVHAAVLADMFGISSNTLLGKTGKSLSNLMSAGDGRLPLSYKMKKFFNSLDRDPFKTFFNFKEIIPSELRPTILSKQALELLSPYDPFKAYGQHLPTASQLELPDALSYLDKKVFLPNSIFHGSDNAFMRQSVELRVPFMDNELVNFSCSVPSSVKFEMFSPKHLLKSVLKQHSAFGSNFNLKNHKKRGFEVPGNYWIQNPKFEALVRTVLSKQSIKKIGFFNWVNVNKLIVEHQAKTHNHERALQVIMSLQLFLSTKA